jgi:hypothetical protein
MVSGSRSGVKDEGFNGKPPSAPRRKTTRRRAKADFVEDLRQESLLESETLQIVEKMQLRWLRVIRVKPEASVSEFISDSYNWARFLNDSTLKRFRQWAKGVSLQELTLRN